MNNYGPAIDDKRVVHVPLAGGRGAVIILPEDGLRQKEAERVARIVSAYAEIPPLPAKEN